MNNTPKLTFFDLDNDVTAFSTTRHGGVSLGSFASFNINPYCGDSDECVAANKKHLAQKLGVDEARIVMPHQTHGVEVRQIAEDFFRLPKDIQDMLLDGVDAVMTDIVKTCVGVSTADCIPILLYDKAHHAVCAVHAGWRGTVAKIAKKAVSAMTFHYHTDPASLQALIGPGISLDAFEVGDEVYEEFVAADFNMEQISERREKWHIDLWECNRLQLVEAGVDAHRVEVSGICTYTNYEEYFSARRLGSNSGRIYSGIFINDNK